MWKNETECGIHATRFIMSWVRMGGTFKYGKDYDNFEAWLKSLKINGGNLSEQDVEHIVHLARNGKMELEHNAKMWLEK